MAVEAIGGVTIRPARRSEWELLREIAFRAKSHWGYDAETVRSWAARMDLGREPNREVYVAQLNGQPIGWSSLIPKGEAAWLDDLWIEPAWMGKGAGARLFRHAADRARQLGASRLEWEAEPNAIGFYEKMGGQYLRETEPNEWGRRLAIMGLTLAV